MRVRKKSARIPVAYIPKQQVDRLAMQLFVEQFREASRSVTSPAVW